MALGRNYFLETRLEIEAKPQCFWVFFRKRDVEFHVLFDRILLLICVLMVASAQAEASGKCPAFHSSILQQIVQKSTAQKLLSEDEYLNLLKLQTEKGVVNLDSVPRPGLAKVAKDGKIKIVQGAGRWSRAMANDDLDLFIPQSAAVPEGAVVLEEQVPAVMVKNINLLSVRGTAGTNPEFMDMMLQKSESHFKRVLVKKKHTKAIFSFGQFELDDLIEKLEKKISREELERIMISPEFENLNTDGQVQYLKKLLDEQN